MGIQKRETPFVQLVIHFLIPRPANLRPFFLPSQAQPSKVLPWKNKIVFHVVAAPFAPLM
jgi:hypothetical protein